MNKEEESGNIPINKITNNNLNKNISNVPNTFSNCFIKQIKASSIQKNLPKKNMKEKYKFNKIILNNIKKYDLNQSQKNSYIINDIINKKQNHFCSIYRDYFIYKCQDEFFRKYYHKDESVKRFPKFYLYYCNYFKFFLKPMLSDLYMCDLIRKNGDNQAKYFYDKYNHFKDKTKQKDDKYDFKSIFTIITKNEIDNNADIVNSDNISKIENNNTNTNTNNNPKQKNINESNYNQSTLILSYNSLDNSKNKNIEQIEEPSISLLSIANLINQNKNLSDKDEENDKIEEKFIKNKINLFLNLDDKITQKSTTILTSTRRKMFDSLKEKTILKRRKNVFKYKYNDDEIHNLNNNNSNNNIRIVKNENKEIKHDINLNSKNPQIKNNENLSSPQNPKINKIYEKNNKNDSLEKISFNNENKMIANNSRNDKRRSNFHYINTNINLNMNLKPKTTSMNLRYTKSNTSLNTIKNLRPRKQPSCTLKTDFYQTSHIVNNNNNKKCCSSISSLKSSINTIEKLSQNKSKFLYKNSSHKNYNNFRTQITRVQKKIPASRNISTDFTHNRKMDNPPKNIFFFSSGLNQINKNEKIYKNNNICLSSHIFYKTFKNEDNKNLKGINNLKKDSEKKISVYNGLSRRNLTKNRLYSSSIEDKKQTLNKLFKELENLTLLKHNKENNNDKCNRCTVIEYNQKYN